MTTKPCLVEADWCYRPSIISLTFTAWLICQRRFERLLESHDMLPWTRICSSHSIHDDRRVHSKARMNQITLNEYVIMGDWESTEIHGPCSRLVHVETSTKLGLNWIGGWWSRRPVHANTNLIDTSTSVGMAAEAVQQSQCTRLHTAHCWIGFQQMWHQAGCNIDILNRVSLCAGVLSYQLNSNSTSID